MTPDWLRALLEDASITDVLLLDGAGVFIDRGAGLSFTRRF